MEHNVNDMSGATDGGDSDANSTSSVPNLESASNSSNNDGQPDGSDWETDEDEGHGAEDHEMSSPGPTFMGGSGPYPIFHSLMDTFEVDDDDQDYDDEEDFWSEDLDPDFDFDMDDDGLWYEDSVLEANIEDLTPLTRAVLHEGEEDVMSEFSGDEKYEPKETLSGNNGEGEEDMFDPPGYFVDSESDKHEVKLSMTMRQLCINLDKGRRERERLHGVSQTSQGPKDPAASTQSHPQQKKPFSRHQLILRGPDQPQEIAYSPSTATHYQCCNALAVAPSNLGLRDDIYTVHDDSIIRCGVLDAMTEELHRQRRRIHAHDHDDLPLPELVNPSVKPLKMTKATKFLDRSLYNYSRLPTKEKLILLDEETAICMAVRYGYLILGTEDGTLLMYCLQDNGEPLIIYEGSVGPDDAGEEGQPMINSVDIVRWPRYLSPAATEVEEGMEDHGPGETEGDDSRGDPTARLTEKDMYDHFVVMTGNDMGLFIASLPDHVDSNGYHGMMPLEEDGRHAFKFKKGHFWIRQGFDDALLNDARMSPDGKWIAVVGDAQKVWVIKIEQTYETELQRRQRLMEDLETDESEYESDEDNTTTSKRRKTRVVEVLADDAEDAEQRPNHSAGSSKGAKTRLLRSFGKPETLYIPDHVIRPPRARRPGAQASHAPLGPNPAKQYSSQYVAWNASSTKFAHTSDTHQAVLIWSMPSKQLVCCVDAGGPSFGISFHPKLNNVFAFANRYGFVHVVDITDCCIGDEGFILPKSQYRFRTAAADASGARPPTRSTHSSEHHKGRDQAADPEATESLVQECGPPHYQEKHDILLTSFRGQENRWLRILDYLNGIAWSTDGRHLYVATKRRVLRYTMADPDVRIPSLFDICANRTKEWLEQRMLTRHNKKPGLQKIVDKAHVPIPSEWELVPSWIKQRIFGDHIQLRYHDG
ncbi:hypothetical protein BGZ73_000119 [Actinomortierella ambigua]|nr:hypothetical protein BGZ73_000119 [Actinomortierella ambigua]